MSHYGRDVWDLTQKDIDSYPVWLRAKAWCEPPHTPLGCQFYYGWSNDAFARGAQTVSQPRSQGFYLKLYKGHGYLTVRLPHEDEKARQARYQAFIEPVIEDPFGYVDKLVARLEAVMEPFAKADVTKMTDDDLMGHSWDIARMESEAAYIYFLGWYSVESLPKLFLTMAGEFTGLKSSDPEYSRLISGIDNDLYRTNTGIAGLAGLAVESGLGNIILETPDSEVTKAMEQSADGRNWLNKLGSFLAINQWRLGREYEVIEPGWYEDPMYLMPHIRRYVQAGGGLKAETERVRLTKEREEATNEFLAKVPQAQQKLMGKLLTCCQASTYFAEMGAWHGELKRYAFGRRCYMEIGRRMAQYGTIERPDDVLMLFHDEIQMNFLNREKGRLVSLCRERRAEWESYKALTSDPTAIPMFFGDPAAIPEMLERDPTFSVGVSVPFEKPEEVGAIVTGGAGAPGVIEGTARVIMDETQWSEVKPGDIMVCPMTSAAWTPLFSIISGLVCESGGHLSHPAIVAREYAIPAVVGTGDATAKIKTGDRIRVDGNLLRVYKL
jgi:phosphohistidine swiveling domain-containing protein